MPANITVQQYRPSEIINIFNDILARQNTEASGKIVCIRGIYLVGNGVSYQGYCYDTLRDENTTNELPIKISEAQRKDLKPGSLVDILGTLGRKISPKSEIKLELNVSRVETVQEQAIDEKEIKRMELRRKKAKLGFRNVDFILEQLLYTDQRPSVALLFAGASITMTDFLNGGGDIAKAAFDFVECRVSFSKSQEVVNALKGLDAQNHTAICIVRGGGSGIEMLDDLNILETVVGLKTPVISAIGHPDERLFIKEVADKEVSVPNDLGHYFKDMMETVSEKKTKSRAVLTEQIKKQFKDQLEAGQKQNKELQEKLTKLTKTQEEATKKHNEQVQALTKAQTEATKQHKEQVEAIQKQHKEQLEKTNKQNEELQKKLTEITKANETAQKAHAEQLGKLQGQVKAQTEASAKQSKEFSESLKKMQDTNTELNKSLQKLTAQNTQAAKDLQEAKDRARDLEKQLQEALSKNKGCSTGCLGMIAAIISIASVACWIVCFIV